MGKASQAVVALPPVVDLDALDDVLETLMAAMMLGPVMVSGADVERVSTNALMLLASAAETARRNDFAFQITAPSPALLAAIERLGFGGRFGAMMKG